MGKISVCAVEDCSGHGPFVLGWCPKHYQRYRRNGSPTTPAAKPSLEDLFWAKVDKDGPLPDFAPDLGPCWIWQAARTKHGYGMFGVSPPRLAHRRAYEWLVGPIPEGLPLDHLCRVPPCVNPQHLEPVTHTQNMRRSPITLATINAAKTHCAQGHPFDEANTRRQRVSGWRICATCARAAVRESTRRAKLRAEREQHA